MMAHPYLLAGAHPGDPMRGSAPVSVEWPPADHSTALQHGKPASLCLRGVSAAAGVAAAAAPAVVTTGCKNASLKASE